MTADTITAIKKAFPNMFRPLEWHHFDGKTEHGTGEWFAHGTSRSYHIYDVRSKYPNDNPFYAKEISDQFETLEAAQEAVRVRDEQDIFLRLDPDFLSALESSQREREVLRSALADLTSWFEDGVSIYGPWIIRSGEHGADAAVTSAQAALSSTGDTHGN